MRSLVTRRARSARRLALVLAGLVVLGAIGSALAPPSETGPRHGSPTAGRTRGAPPVGAKVGESLLSAAQLDSARTAAGRFLAGYLPFAYGRGSASAIQLATQGLRRKLLRKRAQVTPVERRRHPRVVSLQAAGQAPGEVLATAMVGDGGITAYALRLTVEEIRGSWLVSDVDGG